MGSGRGVAGDGQDGVTVLLAVTSADITTVVQDDTEDGDLRTQSKSSSAEILSAGLWLQGRTRQGQRGGIGIVHRVGIPRQDDSLGLPWQVRNLLRAGEHLFIYLIIPDRRPCRPMRDKRKSKSCPRGLNHLSRPPKVLLLPIQPPDKRNKQKVDRSQPKRRGGGDAVD
jgi:hypothetical protein